ncbi:hypothetical protein B9Q03_11195 [Candidatus Marsarchaeota G2 archaeon OSP_D]|uniref:Antitoxin SocA-like Panacea domain-containing protein n=1 Tax=Candidatus Marsarchaeota G2 archaeon OSP_D TaxID=1978157 RepID=A0A2R6AL47_9ARCH|nr:MAG: hypothetical protein B9Q03_11195 [Candidatus Marsarchaeota G2 archaeon OSP_D]
MDIFSLGDIVEAAVHELLESGISDKLQVQKAVFLFLWLYAKKKGFDFQQIISMMGYEPYKMGPFSEQVDEIYEQVSAAVKYGKFNFNIQRKDKQILDEVKEVVAKLSPTELAFYIYFNPYIPKNIRKYFVSKSILLESFLKSAERYVQAIEKKGLIDSSQKEVILNEVKEARKTG